MNSRARVSATWTCRPIGSGEKPGTTPRKAARASLLKDMGLPKEQKLDLLTGRGAEMANQLRVTLEIGPKGKQVAAVAPDWPGLERGAKTGEAAIERLQSYLPRYAQVAKLAGMDGEFTAITTVDMVERYPGTGSTDFWGISFAFSSIDRQNLSSAELERELTLMHACWAFFDDVRLGVAAQM